MLLLHIPAYHVGSAQRTEVINLLASTFDVRASQLAEVAAGRYYLHPVGLVIDPRSATCYVVDTHRDEGYYNYITIPPRLSQT